MFLQASSALRYAETVSNPYLLSIPSGTIVAKPIVVDLDAGSLMIRMSDGASATVFVKANGSAVSIDVEAGREANLTIVCLQNGASSDVSLSQKGRIAEGGSIHWINVTLGAAVAQTLTSEVSGVDGRSDIDWIFFAHDKHRQKISADNVFSAARGAGEITMRGIARDRGIAECKGMIKIGPNGSGTDTYLTQNMLMLDSTAKVDAVPGLEIKTNDVKASHSATVSRITAEDLFTFTARGIEEEDARSMLIEGFLGEMIGKIADGGVRGIVEEALAISSPSSPSGCPAG